MSEFFQKLRGWFGSNPLPYPDTLYSPQDRVFFQTGDELVGRILRAIQLNQSVVLSGPRGCGKSKCIALAIKRAESEGIIPPQGWIKSQGNKEIPRDYLAEDGLTFRFTKDKDVEQVNPAKQKAPFFKFAARDEQFQEPVRDPVTRRVNCEIQRSGDPSNVKRPVSRFVVFLDEINRFSDGVLDSLLTVLEERTVILSGDEYKLPVVVCMTMNPPGYDATARKLSPPLAARIGRSYRLYTPDLDTLTDVIIRDKMREQAENRFLFAFDMLRALSEVLGDVAKCKTKRNPHLSEPIAEAAAHHESVSALVQDLDAARKDGRLSLLDKLPALKELHSSLRSKLPEDREESMRLLKEVEDADEPEKEAKSLPSRMQECLDQLLQVVELEELFPEISIPLRRKIALITLCLWGEPREPKPGVSSVLGLKSADGTFFGDSKVALNAVLQAFRRPTPTAETKPGHEYLTADTVDLLQRLAKKSAALRRDMQTIGDLCHYGPDGRAAWDWLLTAIGLAIERRRLRDLAENAGNVPSAFTRAVLSVQDLTDTAIECVGLKIYDRFSATSQPDLLFKKEQAVLSMARVVLADPKFDAVVARIIDTQPSEESGVSLLWKMTGGEVPLKNCSTEDEDQLRDIFLESGVTADRHVLAWFRRVGTWLASQKGNSVPDQVQVFDLESGKWRTERIVVKESLSMGPRSDLLTLLTWDGDGTKMLLEKSKGKSAEKSEKELAGFTNLRWRTLAEKLVKFHEKLENRRRNSSPMVCRELAQIWEDIRGPVRALPIDDLLLKFECARVIGGIEFGRLCRDAKRQTIDKFAAELDSLLWTTNGDPFSKAAESKKRINSSISDPTSNALMQDLLVRLRAELMSQRGKTAERQIITIAWFLDLLDQDFMPKIQRCLGVDASKRFPGGSFRKFCESNKLTRSEEFRLAVITYDIFPGGALDFAIVKKKLGSLNGTMAAAVVNLAEHLRQKR